jgi:Protein of unknown function (DUF664)
MDRETEALLSALDDQRQHVLGIIDGLTPETLLRPVLPSGWSCAGLVRHLTYDVPPRGGPGHLGDHRHPARHPARHAAGRLAGPVRRVD